MKRSTLTILAVTLAGCLPATTAHAAILFTLSPPTVQQSPLQGDPGSLTETFNSFFTGNLPVSGVMAVGNFTTSGAVSIYAADVWGGAGGVGNFAATTENSALSIDLLPSKYLGFWWSAGNDGNLVRIYGDDNTLLATFDSNVIPILIGPKHNPNNVVATDGNTYSGFDYYGNPNGPAFNNGDSINQPYAYVNLRLSDPSLSFSRIEFTGFGFEFDNITVSSEYYDPTAAVPEPGTWAAAALLVAGGWLVRRHRRAKAA